LGLGTLAGGATWLWHEAESARRSADQEREEAQKARCDAVGARDRAVKGERDLAQLIYCRQVDLAHREWQENRVARAIELLNDCDPNMRHWEWRYVHRLCHAYLKEFKGHRKEVTCVAFSPDGRRIASGSKDQTVKVWDAQTAQEVLTLNGHTYRVASVAFSPDGQWLASGSWDDTVKIWDGQTGRQIRNLQGHTDKVTSVAFSPNGRWIASGSADKTVIIWDAQTGQKIHTLQRHKDKVTSVAFQPDGQRLASGSADKTVNVWNTQTGQVTLSFWGKSPKANANQQDVPGNEELPDMGADAGVLCLAYSPEGGQLAIATEDMTVTVRDVQTGKVARTFQVQTKGLTSLAFSPEGQRLALGTEDMTVMVRNAQTGEMAHTFKGHTKTVTSGM
jgi:WD40 repeat protein